MLSEKEKGEKDLHTVLIIPQKTNLSLDPSLSPVLQVKAIFNIPGLLNIVIVWSEHKKEKKITLWQSSCSRMKFTSTHTQLLFLDGAPKVCTLKI